MFETLTDQEAETLLTKLYNGYLKSQSVTRQSRLKTTPQARAFRAAQVKIRANNTAIRWEIRYDKGWSEPQS